MAIFVVMQSCHHISDKSLVAESFGYLCAILKIVMCYCVISLRVHIRCVIFVLLRSFQKRPLLGKKVDVEVGNRTLYNQSCAHF